MRQRRAVVLLLLLAVLVATAGCAGSRNAVDNQRAAEANASLGADFLRKEDNEQALSRFQRALGYDSNNLAANWGMAIVSDRLGETQDAERYYEKTLDLQPGAPIYNSYAAFLCKQGDVDRAVKYFSRASKDPRYAGRADALANAGLCLHRADRVEAAERYHRQALAANADQFTALSDMARLKFEQGDFLRARAFNERADSVSQLAPEQLLLGARIELALGDREAASAYVERHNSRKPSATLSLRQLEQSR
ncbi:type IV pilus biogenesis/stability protein PilW [Salinisphaera dokdonensis CL-ES53]|uniref:Type IV pilus biogenesis/stability protein PilW n=1 Tax=Salinisphaera dokdonensis CL-ES53 TaxID=1304272 RepID=A0ABV2AY94_9GAMM